MTTTELPDAIAHRTAQYIDGRWAPSFGDELTEIVDSADGAPFGSVPKGVTADIDAAVDAARRALPGWAATAPVERARLLDALSAAVAARAEVIAEVITREVGSPMNIALRVQAALPVSTLAGFATAARELEWEREVGNSLIVREPVGVVGAITPWNYPLHQLVGKVGGALAAGCTVVAKPADVAPLSAFILADAAEEVGLPAGVLNVVSGPGRVIGEHLAGHSGIDMLSFTGSTEVGARIAAVAAANITPVALELGGKSASVVLDDADFDKAVRSSVGNAFLNSGQTCSAWTRLVVPRGDLERTIDLVTAAVGRLTLGHPRAEGTRLGPLASKAQQRIVRGYIDAAVDAGQRLILGGSAQPEGLPEGYYVSPTVFADVDNSAVIAQEEVFGPVLVIIAHDGDDDAVRIANDSPYGLAGAVWSGDEERALAVAAKIRTGQVDVNGGAFNPVAPFGGYKRSGYGRELGEFGVEHFLQTKAIQR